MNPIDAKLGKVLKNSRNQNRDGVSVAREYRKIRASILDDKVGDFLDRAFTGGSDGNDVQLTTDPLEFFQSMFTLLEREFVITAEAIAASNPDLVKTLTLRQLIRCAGGPRTIATWAKLTGTSKTTVAAELKMNLEETYLTFGAEWLLQNCKPSDLRVLLRKFFNRTQRPSYLPDSRQTLALSLAADKNGALLEFILCHESSEVGDSELIAEAILSQPDAMRTAAEALPRLAASKNVPSSVNQLIDAFCFLTKQSSGQRREETTLFLVRTAVGIAARRPAGECCALLEKLTGFLAALESATAKPEKANTWILKNLGIPDAPLIEGVHITEEGARRLAVGFEKAQEGFPVADILRMVASNLGLRNIGAKGERVSFDPLTHEDAKGGMVPGDQGTITQEGLKLGEAVVIRAIIVR